MKLIENLYVDNLGAGLYYKYKNTYFKKNPDKNIWSREINKEQLYSWDLPTNYKSKPDKIQLTSIFISERMNRYTHFFSEHKLNIKIKESVLSAKIHGFKRYKDELIGTKTLNYRFDGEYEKKDWKGFVVSIYSPSKEGFIAFCSEDLEFVLPDFSKYKDLKIEKGTILKCKNDKGYCGKVLKHQKVGVLSISKTNPYNQKPHIIDVIDEKMNKIKVYRKDFRVI